MRFTKMIPNMFTLGNLYCGFLSIGFAANGQFNNAAILILDRHDAGQHGRKAGEDAKSG